MFKTTKVNGKSPGEGAMTKKALKDEFWTITDLYQFHQLQEECVKFMLNLLDLK